MQEEKKGGKRKKGEKDKKTKRDGNEETAKRILQKCCNEYFQQK